MKIGKGMLGISVTALLLTAAGATSAAGMARVADNTPPAVAKAAFVGHHNPKAVFDISLALPLQNRAVLDQFLHDVQDRTSPSYHKFLTPAQFKTLYGPSQTQVNAAIAFLQQHGIKLLGVSGNNTRIFGQASVATLEAAFGVAINDYQLNGVRFYSASADPTVPASLHVAAVFGLDDAVQWKPHSTELARPSTAIVGPSGYTPAQIAHHYDWPDITDLSNGAGVHIAIVTAFNFRPADLIKFWSTMGLPPHNVANHNAVTVVPEQLGPTTLTTNVLNAETTLDTERSSSMAPGAAIDVYECVTPANFNFDTIFTQLASANSSTVVDAVVTTSWGLDEAESGLASIGAEHTAFVEMAAQGMTVMAAAGDDGSRDRDSTNNPLGGGKFDNADFPSSDPFVISAGGTTLTLDASGNLIGNEAAWAGSGGADSMIFEQPSYENSVTGLTPNSNCSEDVTSDPGYTADDTGVCTSASDPSRQNSDMSLDGGSGYAIYYNGRWEVFIGTSFVAPEFAGLFADLTQSYGSPVGPGPALVYCVGTDPTPVTSPVFNDITVNPPGGNGAFNAGPGWDHPTGFGTPDVNNFIADAKANCLPP